MLKPCLDCGEPSEGTRCDEHRRAQVRDRSRARTRRTDTARWKRLSRRLRKLSPFCEFCGATDTLSVDHIIPVSQRPDLEYVIDNCRILCRSCNSARGDRVTDDERAAVLQRIATRGGAPTRSDLPTSGKSKFGSHMRTILNKEGG